MNKKDYLSKVLYTQAEIEKRIKELANDINQHYKNIDDNVLVVPIMDGSLVFASNLLLELDFMLHVRSTKITSYHHGIISNNDPKLLIHIPMDLVKGKHILVVEDLIDSGQTLSLFVDYLKQMGAISVKVCVLFNKQVKNRKREVKVDFLGFEIPDKWVAGYGIDSQGFFRNLKDFGIVNPKYIIKN